MELKLEVKVKRTLPHEECWWSSHLHYVGLELVKVEKTTEICDA